MLCVWWVTGCTEGGESLSNVIYLTCSVYSGKGRTESRVEGSYAGNKRVVCIDKLLGMIGAGGGAETTDLYIKS